MKPGDLLLPNEYLQRNGTNLTGIILSVTEDTWGLSYKYLLSNGITLRSRMKDICDLFDVVEIGDETG